MSSPWRGWEEHVCCRTTIANSPRTSEGSTQYLIGTEETANNNNVVSKDDPYNRLDPDQVREELQRTGEMAVAHLCYAALDHASDGITNADEKLINSFHAVAGMDCERRCNQCQDLLGEIREWIFKNPIKAFLMVLGLGGTIYKAKTLKHFLESHARGYIDWSRGTSRLLRFLGFVALMVLRLGISTAVPPTSPAFGIIIQAATPKSEKWTAMPFFLLSSTVAGAFPYLMDKILDPCFPDQGGFAFTFLMKWVTEVWPLTCWTAPAMMKVFDSAGGDKMGACLAVIVAHAAPFMGAQTTLMQRYFLPHPLDTIISQPFGMSEDLVSMALAEAGTDPKLASLSLTILIVAFNLLRFLYFSNRDDSKAALTAGLNIVAGVAFLDYLVPLVDDMSPHWGLALVSSQLLVQGLLVPFISRLCCCFNKR